MSYNSSTNEDVVKTKINGVINPSRKRKKFKFVKDNHLRGSYAETDLKKGTIRVNVKRHKIQPTHKKRYPEMLDTKVHESLHVKHPTMTEREVRKKTHSMIKKMTKKQKSKVYDRNTIYQNNSYQRK